MEDVGASVNVVAVITALGGLAGLAALIKELRPRKRSMRLVERIAAFTAQAQDSAVAADADLAKRMQEQIARDRSELVAIAESDSFSWVTGAVASGATLGASFVAFSYSTRHIGFVVAGTVLVLLTAYLALRGEQALRTGWTSASAKRKGWQAAGAVALSGVIALGAGGFGWYVLDPASDSPAATDTPD